MKKTLLFLVSLASFIFAGNSVFSQTGSTCALADVISAVPYSATGLTTIGTTYSSLPCSGTIPNYMSGADYVFSFTPSVTGSYSIALTNTSYFVGLFVTDLCPDDASVTCIASNTSATGNPTLTTNLTGGTSYYIVVSSVSTITASTSFDISVQYCSGITPVSSFTYLQSGLDVTFTNTSTDATSYLWYFGDELLPFPLGAAETTANPTHTYTSYGTYTVYLIAYNCGASDTTTIIVDVVCPGTMPVASLTYVANGLTVDFTSTSTDATSWQWFFGDTDVFPLVSGSTIENPSHTYLAGGTYTLNLIVSNECGSDTISTTITVVGTGISSNSTDIAFNIYPNPAFESVMVSTKENAEIFLINELGQIILTTKSKRENTEISLLGLSKGIYTIKINSEEHTEQQILVIQ